MGLQCKLGVWPTGHSGGALDRGDCLAPSREDIMNLLSPITVFIICYLFVRIEELTIPEPSLRFIKLVTYVVALVLVIVVALGRLG